LPAQHSPLPLVVVYNYQTMPMMGNLDMGREEATKILATKILLPGLEHQSIISNR
jgi:hypothetical protein